jgi:hypothetical protein
MTIPLNAIDPDAAYREWVDRFLWHVDQLPALVETTGTIRLAVRGLQAAVLHERVSGGGYIDNIPVVDGPESRNARAIWDAMRRYLVVASSRIGVEGPQLPAMLPDEVDVAREWAYAANAWLADVVYAIQAWDDLTQLEEHLFSLVRRARGRLATSTARRTRPELCIRCGENGVLIDWIDGPDGHARLSKVCVVCRTNYTPATGA